MAVTARYVFVCDFCNAERAVTVPKLSTPMQDALPKDWMMMREIGRKTHGPNQHMCAECRHPKPRLEDVS